MKPSSAFLCAVIAAAIAGCNSEHASEPVLWTPLASVSVDSGPGSTSAVAVPLDNLRRALRVSAQPQGCLQVSSAISVTGEELIADPAASDADIWRTTKLHQAGLLVLEGVAAELSHISFAAVPCDTAATGMLPTSVRVESRLSELPTNPGLKLRLVLSQAISAELDAELLAQLIGFELQLDMAITGVEVIADTDLIMQSQADFSPLAAILALLPTKAQDTIDLVIGPCLLQQTSFGLQQLAGFTPRIPGGAGPADGVFVARTSCGFAGAPPGTVNEIARLAAHEIGHYLGLAHPEELDGSKDDLASTSTHNLMHRVPLAATATGLTSEQRSRILAHPFVTEL
ncbi:hypothetical protein [Rheinheimera sp. EpRS3]|uniref:hypothetical protein n=1 Tax=Rheinheimera sp. EpRS3 TaxID=1712383 RepID=UPI00074764CD|nr:hypothetical protein [Rheinheimera sp. EpRS3]KUM54102.1 hypothetical protein AR688_12225 [Rheinheimera sp. EpRS3]